MEVTEAIWQAFRHFVYLDESNAAIHIAETRYSPLTFRLAEVLYKYEPLDYGERDALVAKVYLDRGKYPEDKGRE